MSTDLSIVEFDGARILCRRGDNPASVLVAMRPVVEAIGLAWSGQYVKLQEHPVLGPTVRQIITVAEDGKEREMVALPLNRVNFWLATINPAKVPDPDIRAKVIAYQEKCADALFEHFFGQGQAASDDIPVDPVRTMPDRTMKQWLDLIREARLLRGKAAAEALWAQSPLPPLPEVPLSSRPVDRDAERYHPKTPLTREQEADIRARYAAGGVSMAALAKEYGVWISMIQRTLKRPQFDA